MDAVADPAVSVIAVMKSAQVGWTEILGNVVGYHIHQDPAPMLLLQPTLEMAQAWSKDRLAPMLRDTPALQGRVKDPRSRDSGNTMLHKTFPGGHITMAGANSPASLASRPIRVVLCDEVDRYPASAGAEGDPINLAKKRSTTFWNRKLLIGSTPTVKGASRIEAAFESSDQRYFFVPCTHCGEHQRLVWKNIQWPEGEPEKAGYVCEHCGTLLTDADKPKMLAQGEWRSTEPFNGTAGFHISELYSPWVTWPEIAAAFLEAKKLPETLQTFVNTVWGETWEEAGETVDETGLMSRREVYPAEVPAGALVLTCAVDVQDDRLELEVEGWGHDEENWGIDHRVLWGDPAEAQVWDDLDAVLESTYTHESDTKLHIAATCIDSGGHHTQQVYDYCKRRAHRRVFAIKGVGGAGRPIVSAPNKKKTGRDKKQTSVFTVGVDDAKGVIYARLRKTEPGPGYRHFPESYDEEFFAQLTAEKCVTRYHKGFPRREWIKTRARNEAFDLSVYNLAAIKLLNPVWDALESKLQPTEPEEPEQPKQKPLPRKRAKPARRRGGFVNNWR